MTQDEIDYGRLMCAVGVLPVPPAEFVIFRIRQVSARLARALHEVTHAAFCPMRAGPG